MTTLISICLAAALARADATPQAREKSAGAAKPVVMEVGRARIEVSEAIFAAPKSTGRLDGWLSYSLARWLWSDSEFRKRFPAERKYRYSFEEELEARETAGKIWGEMREKEPLTDRYFGDLQKIQAAGFLRDYVWYCVPHPRWSPPGGLRQAELFAWLSANLPDHQVETWVTVTHGASGARVILGAQPQPPQKCRAPEGG